MTITRGRLVKHDDEPVDFDEYVCTGVKLLNMILLEPASGIRFGNADLTGAWIPLPDVAITPDGISGVYGYLRPVLQQLQIGTRWNVDFKINGMGQLILFKDEHGVTHVSHTQIFPQLSHHIIRNIDLPAADL